MQKKFLPFVTLLMVVVIVLAANLIGALLFRNVKLDLTEERIFTLSDGTRSIIRNLEDDVSLKLFYSRKALMENAPNLRQWGERVQAMLEEYEGASRGHVELEVIDPRPDTEEEALAERYGLQGIPISQFGAPVFLGLVATDESGHENVLPVFDPNREGLLEYDVTKLIADLARADDKPRLGLISSLPVTGSAAPPNPMMPQPQQTEAPWAFMSELENSFEVEELEADLTEVPEDIELLLLVHPKELSDAAQYALDQFVLRGGRMVAFLDPMSEAEMQNAPQGNMQMRMQMEFNSNLPKLLEAWGLEMIGADTPQVIGDPDLGVEVRTQRQIEQMLVWLQLGADNRNDQEIVTNGLEQFIVATAGGLRRANNREGLEVAPLLTTGERAAPIETTMLKFGMMPGAIRRDFEPGDESITLAYKLSGTFSTAFPDGPPADDEDGEDEEAEGPPEGHLTESAEPTTVLVVADTDLLSDRFAVRTMNFFGRQITQAANDNLALLFNALDNLSGSQELLTLRSRGSTARPFTRVQELEREAQREWQQEEKRLESRLQEINQELSELQRGTEDAQVLDQEYIKRVEEFRQERLETRQKLREVRRSLREDVERLEARIRFINIGLIPLVIILGSIAVAAGRAVVRRFAR